MIENTIIIQYPKKNIEVKDDNNHLFLYEFMCDRNKLLLSQQTDHVEYKKKNYQ